MMIERLAKSLARFAGVDPNGPLWAERGDHFRRMADAALTEMVEPTDAMVRDVIPTMTIGNSDLRAQLARSVWYGMITAARQS